MEQENKRGNGNKKYIVLVLIALIAVGAIVGLLLFLNSKGNADVKDNVVVASKEPEETVEPKVTAEPEVTPAPAKVSKDEMMANVAPEHREDFELVIADKIANGINDYTYEDYLAALEKEKEKEEESSKINVEDVEDINANKEVIKQTIIRDITRYNQYIYDHCGYPESEYGVGPHAIAADPNVKNWSLFVGVMMYMDELVDYAAGKTDYVYGSEVFDVTLDQQVLGLRGAMFNGIPYEQDAKFGEYHFILANFLADGHPDIDSVENLSLEYVNEIMDFDSHQVGVIATFTCNGTKYTCWLESTSMSADGAYYTVLDLKKN